MFKNVVNRLAGIFPNNDEALRQLEQAIAEGEALRKLQTYPEWPVFQRILDQLYTQAVNKLGTKDFKKADWWEVNCRVGVLLDIRNNVFTKMKAAEEARSRKNKLNKPKEESHDRAQ